MSEQTSEALRAWFRRVEPMYPELFNTAHAICGNYDQAEYALRSAIVEVWSQNADGGMGFREKLRSTVREEAFDAVRDSQDAPPDFTWPGFSETGEDPLLRQACRESAEVQRVLMLRHGVGLSPGRIAQITGDTASQVRSTLDRFESRCRRVLSAQERNRFDALFARAARRQLGAKAGIPHIGTVYRAFEAEASRLRVPEHRVARVAYHVVVFLMALICAALFWLFAVLVQSPSIEQRPSFDPAVTESPAEFNIETTYETEAPA